MEHIFFDLLIILDMKIISNLSLSFSVFIFISHVVVKNNLLVEHLVRIG